MERKRASGRSRMALVAFALVGGAAAGVYHWVTAADHVDSPFVRDNVATDIADVYVFKPDPSDPDPGSVVLAMTVSGVLAPQELVGRSIFDRNTLYQFEIDTDISDGVDEDLVIQGFVIGGPENQKMEIIGPAPPVAGAGTGTSARIVRQAGKPFRVQVSTGPEAISATRWDGLKAFAGVRDDPFFFDLAQFQKILSGDAGSFNDPGTDFFAGLNVYAIVVEVPLELLGATHISELSSFAVWGTTSQR